MLSTDPSQPMHVRRRLIRVLRRILPNRRFAGQIQNARVHPLHTCLPFTYSKCEDVGRAERGFRYLYGLR